MNTRVSLVWASCLVCTLAGAACDQAADRNTKNTTGTPTATPTPGPTSAPKQADNTGRNRDDTSADKTPMDQSNSSADIKVTAEIRRAIMDDKSMSTNAQNCKIITDKAGVVTLRGPVASQAEKDAIAAKAQAVAGVSRVVNELEVKAN